MTGPAPGPRALREDIARFVRGEGGDFGALALRLFRQQVEHNPHYRAIVGATVVRSWEEIPCVPVALWRDVPLVSFPLKESALVFRTSGTTGRRGAVHRLDTELYDLGARRFAEQVVGAIPTIGVSLVPDAEDSSLGHMCRAFSPELVSRFSGRNGVDWTGALSDLQRFSQRTEPVFLPGTALALAELVTRMEAPILLAKGSIVMVTGGFKGKVARVSATTLRAELVRLFPGAAVVEEYGMTELSSQMWAPGPGEPLQVPPWMKVMAVDPWTGAPAQRGLLRFVDLANIDTVLAIETRDEGTLLEDGRLILHGRLPGAPARGCSLTVEEATRASVVSRRVPREEQPVRVEQSLSPGDAERAARLVAALGALPPAQACWGQGLGVNAVQRELACAVAALTSQGLCSELSTVPSSARPDAVAIVSAEGVFTAALEWVVLCLAAGISVRWKPPAAWPHFARAVGAVLASAGFPVTVDPSRDPGEVGVIVVFGSDETVQAMVQAHPAARVVDYGHRFGLALVTGPPDAQLVDAVLTDHLRYDARGCMAPAGVGVVDSDVRLWLAALARGMDRRTRGRRRGTVASALGPEWRRRIALGRASLGSLEGGEWAVTAMEAKAWVPSALPWMVGLFPISSGELPALLAHHGPQISVLARPPSLAHRTDASVDRVCVPGQMQSPPFPRLHDGQPMLARICAWSG